MASGILIAGVIFVFAHNFGGGSSGRATIQNGEQVVQMTAKGGYSPNKIVAKAGMPTKLEVATNETFDCSSSIKIPSLGITKLLPESGTTSINIPAQKAGTNITGLCSMGMYKFDIAFE